MPIPAMPAPISRGVMASPRARIVREGWELAGRDAPHVDHVTDDIAGFLKPLAR